MAEPKPEEYQSSPKFTELNELSSEKVGGQIIFATDDWFAVAENLLKTEEPVFKAGIFTEFGKWMDGWETRRKRKPGHDWCIIKLGIPGVIYGVDVDTSYFTGNYAPQISIQATCCDKYLSKRTPHVGTAASYKEFTDIAPLKSGDWEEIVPQSKLQPGYKTSCHNYFGVKSRKKWTYLRLNMYPDGGIARLRVYGQASPDWSRISVNQLIDLVGVENGGVCIGYSNIHFGHARNLIHPGRAETMADGWETARKPERPAILEADSKGILKVPGFEWCVFRLGHPGLITKIELDTNHFKGNYPDSCRIEGCSVSESQEESILRTFDTLPWKPLLPVKKLSAHKRHFYEGNEICNCGVISHVRLSMAPDGGISRMRLWGYKHTSSNSRL